MIINFTSIIYDLYVIMLYIGFTMYSIAIKRGKKGKYVLFFLTGVQELDQILTVLLRTSMFVGGTVGFILDNTIPGKSVTIRE